MIPTQFDYHRAASVDEAIKKLQETGGKLLAGGHSLVPLMKLRLSEPTSLIDIARIPGLAGIRDKDGQIEIGAATVHHDVASSTVLRQKCPMLSDAAGEIGDPQVRNRGTLGGSLRQAASARVALRDCRRRRGARGQERHDPVGACRAHRRQLARHAAGQRGAGACRATAVAEDDRVGVTDRGQGSERDQRRHSRE